MALTAITAFWGVSMLFVITPGADWAFAISAGLRRRAAPAVLGMLSGHVLAVVIVAAGVGALVARYPLALTVLTVAGALYLVWLGIGTLRAPAVIREGAELVEASPGRWMLKGFGISGLNPKVTLLFLAILPQFTAADSTWPLAVQIVILGAVHLVGCAAVYFAVGFGAGSVLRARPAAARIVSIVSGIAMIGIGAVLLVGQLVR
ncbi:LysE family translocator [Microbacterium sp. WCS2018Hpa-9]|uniref:LysE family translocator n=1 Tax=Microbacterium sp. WCS2018Hpa-9 TaxID=3073635 RepID=UPI00288C13A1|nr:LysE family translocator [Microbacterium sp. WCS2018Hpa-9]